MRSIILGVATDIRQADPVLRALERNGFTIDDVVVLLACADERVPPRPAAMQLPALLHPHPHPNPDPHARRDIGFIAVTTQATIHSDGMVVGRDHQTGQRLHTGTVNAGRGASAPSGVARDLHGLGIPLKEARRIALAVREDNVLLLVEAGHGWRGDATISAMRAEGLSAIFTATVVEEGDGAQRPDSSGTCAGGAPPLPTRRGIQPYF